ncbi:MAG TPA: ABC transporter substrate-binding protein [Nitriliruptorales bacterium]
MLYGAVSLVLVAGALTFALSSPPPSTPPLAEVAPAPQEQVEVERVEQSSRFGDGNGAGEGECAPGDEGCAGVGEQPALEPTAPPTVVESSAPGSLRQCVNGPGGLRQTADPQAPPCKVEIFEGANGGATSRGVTATTIRVGVQWPLRGYFAGGNDLESDRRVAAAFASHLRRHYELYQRSIELVYVDRQESSGPAADRAYAEEVASHDLFAMLGGGSPTLLGALADHGIIALEPGRVARSDADVYLPGHGLVWGLFPSTEQALSATGDLVCTALVGRPASHGGAEVAASTRRFGVVSQRGASRRIDAAPLVRRLEACGAPLVEREYDPASDDLEQLMRALEDAGVTTVVCVCDGSIRDPTDAAAVIDWQPEWLLPGLAGFAEVDQIDNVDHSQRGHVFGLTPDFRELTDSAVAGQPSVALEERYWFHVLREEDPSFTFSRINRQPPPKAYDLYAQMLLLGSGIQWAGPDLTPQTFATALEGLRYPNPDVGAPRWYQPAVGFGPADRTFNSDFALAWWSLPEDAETTDEDGRFCYVGDGQRFSAGGFPADADELLFDLEAGCS